MVNTMNLNYTAPINPLGYGVLGLNLLKALVNEGVEVAYFPISDVQTEPSHHAMIQEAVRRQDNFDNRAHSLRVWHQFDMAQFVGRGRRIGFPIFELDRFNNIEMQVFSHIIPPYERYIEPFLGDGPCYLLSNQKPDLYHITIGN